MKPLTIEQLKALPVGEWVWLKRQRVSSTYAKIMAKSREEIRLYIANKFECGFECSDYGTKWIAYKNKEQAEAKGEIVELPCKIGDNGFVIIEDYSISRYKIEEIDVIGFNFCQYDSSIWVVDEYNRSYGKFFKTKSEAEAWLRKLRGESL